MKRPTKSLEERKEKVNGSLYIGLLAVLLAVQAILAAVRAALTFSRWEWGEEEPEAELLHRPDITLLSVAIDFTLLLTIGTYFALGFALMQRWLARYHPAAHWMGLAGLVIPPLVLTWLSLTVGLLAPEAVGQTAAARWDGRTTRLARALHTVVQPLTRPALLVANALARWFAGAEPLQRVAVITEEEIKTLVTAGEQEGIIEEEAREMIYSIFRLGEMIVREVMVPRIDVVALDVESSMADVLHTIIESGHSRIPVYEETIDNIVGILYAKDILAAQSRGNANPALREIIRPAYFVPESKRLDSMLKEMQRNKVQMAIVVDEYGGMAGVVTLEDIVEEIVGEIQDEYDREEPPVIFEADGSYLFEGRIPLDDVQALLDVALPLDEADSLGGFIYNELGHIPRAGETVRYNGLLFEVVEVNGRRIRKVRVRRLPTEEKAEEQEG